MPPTYTTTAKRALRWLTGSNIVRDIDAGFQALAEDVDAKLGSAGKGIIATAETRTNTAYGLLTTPDRVQGIVLPTDGLIFIAYHAIWKESVIGAARAALFLGSNQVKLARSDGGLAGPLEQEARMLNRAAADIYNPLSTSPTGLRTPADDAGVDPAGAVTTGQLVGQAVDTAGEDSGAGVATIFAAAGTYDVSAQFKSTSGSVTVKDRRLWVWTQPF